MAFKFTLESVLKYRRRLENEAQRQFNEARQKLDDAKQKLDALYASVDSSRQQICELQTGALVKKLEGIRDREEFIIGQGLRIQAQRKEVRALTSVVEEKQEELVLALRERKSMEKLKEKRKLEYEKEQLRLESQAMDEISVLRFGRKL